MKRTSSRKHAIRVIVIALLTVGLLILFFRNSDLREVGRLIGRIDLKWLIPGFAANLTALCCRSLRWRIILRPNDPPPVYPTFFATAIGFMSSALLPVRAGDLIRPTLLSRRTDIRFSSALGTVVTERLLDLSSIVTLFLTFVALATAGATTIPASRLGFLRTAGTVALGILAGVITLVVVSYRFREPAERLVTRISRGVPERFRDSLVNLFVSFVTSLKLPSHPGKLMIVLGFTATIWLCLTSQFYFVMHAFGSPLPFTASFLVTALSILGFSIPTPGGVGGFHKACQIVLVSFYGFSIDTSVAVALIFHLVGTAPVLTTGLILFLHEGMSWRQIEELEEEAEEMATGR
ncbi:MAG: lysylphosphatidylglycerol synthase transmembrane domain-containing protein [Thermoanaerobaculia bacterium]|nr:lysylphosphatidylglycerol synthase transmembrane domain-containing protein [Thermoanaerobaculia bacterium]